MAIKPPKLIMHSMKKRRGRWRSRAALMCTCNENLGENITGLMARSRHIGLRKVGGRGSIASSGQAPFHSPAAWRIVLVAILVAGLGGDGNLMLCSIKSGKEIVGSQAKVAKGKAGHLRVNWKETAAATNSRFTIEYTEVALDLQWLNFANDSHAEEAHLEGPPQDHLQQMSTTTAAAATVTGELEQPRFPFDNMWRLGVPVKGKRSSRLSVPWFSPCQAPRIMQALTPTSPSCLQKFQMKNISRTRRKNNWKTRAERSVLEKNTRLWKRTLLRCFQRLLLEARGNQVCKTASLRWGHLLQGWKKIHGGKCGKGARKVTGGLMSWKIRAWLRRQMHTSRPSSHLQFVPKIEAVAGNVLILSFGPLAFASSVSVFWHSLLTSWSWLILSLWSCLWSCLIIGKSNWIADISNTVTLTFVRYKGQTISAASPCVGNHVSSLLS